MIGDKDTDSVEQEDEVDRAHREFTQGQAPGGRTTRGAAINPGGESTPQGLVPPYEGRTGETSESGSE